MNDIIFYRPYKTQIWAMIFVVFVGILSFVGVGYCLPLLGLSVLCLVGIGTACIWLTKVLYDSLNKAVFLEKEGLRIVGDTCSNHRYMPWNELTYAYYVKNYKGHLFLVLSPKVLNAKEAKHFANRGANSSRICIDNAVVIYIDMLQDVSQLRELIDRYVVHVSNTD